MQKTMPHLSTTHLNKQVLKPGGRFLCLEFSHVTVPVLQQVYDAYSHLVIPQIGRYGCCYCWCVLFKVYVHAMLLSIGVRCSAHT